MAASDNTDKIINYAGDFRVKRINIISYRPAEGSEKAFRFDVLNQCMMVQLVEDITMPAITGSLDIADGQDIRTLLPITGNERLEYQVVRQDNRFIDYISQVEKQ